MSRFPAAFRPPAFASRSPCSRPGTGPSSRSAYRPPPGARTRTGFPRFTPARYDRGGCPLYPGDSGAPPGRMPCPAGACRFPAASPCTPHPHPTSGAPQSRGINEGSRDSPVRSAPHLWPPGWDGRPLGFPLCSAPRCHQRRTTGRGRAVSTRPELRDRHSRPSNPRVHSHSATSCRNGRSGHCRVQAGTYIHAARCTHRRADSEVRGILLDAHVAAFDPYAFGARVKGHLYRA